MEEGRWAHGGAAACPLRKVQGGILPDYARIGAANPKYGVGIGQSFGGGSPGGACVSAIAAVSSTSCGARERYATGGACVRVSGTFIASGYSNVRSGISEACFCSFPQPHGHAGLSSFAAPSQHVQCSQLHALISSPYATRSHPHRVAASTSMARNRFIAAAEFNRSLFSCQAAIRKNLRYDARGARILRAGYQLLRGAACRRCARAEMRL